jgi:hypothetical protein
MRIRSQSIGLMPDIEDNCITDLATCKNPEVKGEVISFFIILMTEAVFFVIFSRK